MRATARAIRLLMLRRIRLQPLRAAVAAVTIGAGVALAISIVIVLNSTSTSVDEASRQLAGVTELRLVGATSRGGLDPSTVAAAEQVDGVAAVIPLVQTVTMSIESDGQEKAVLILGVDCATQQRFGYLSCVNGLSALDGPPVISPSLSRELGAGAFLKSDQGRIEVLPQLTLPALDQIAGGRVAVFPMEQAQRYFSRNGRYDIAYIETDAGVDATALKHRIEDTVGGHIGVLGADDPPPSVGTVVAAVIPLFVLAALIALGLGGVLVHNTVALSMEERRHQLAVVGALGGTSRVLVFGTLIEAAALGLVGGALGAGGAVLVARPITAVFSRFTEQVAGIPLRVHVTAGEMTLSLVLGAVVAVAAAWRPARRSRRLDVAAELSARSTAEEARSRSLVRRLGIWTGVMALGLVGCAAAGRNGSLERWQASLAPVAYVVAVVGMSLATGTLAPLIFGWWSSHSRTRRPALRLALTNLSRDAGRVGVMVVAIAVACAIGFVTASFKQSVRVAVSDNLTRNVRGVLISAVKADETANLGGQLPVSAADKVRSLPGVARVNRGATLLVGHTAAELILIDGFDRFYEHGIPVITGRIDPDGFDRGEVVIGGGLAREEGLRPGDMVRLDTPMGHVELPVQAVVYNGSLNGRNVTMSYGRMVEIYGSQPLTGLDVEPAAGVPVQQLLDTVRGANIDPDIEVQTASQKVDEIVDAVGQQLEVFGALQRGMLVLSFVAVVTTLLLVGLQRQREIGLLAAVGMRPDELRSMVITEAVVLGVVGVALGLLVSLPMYAGLLLIAPVIVGFSDPFVLDLSAAVLWAVVGVAVAAAAALWPAWRTSRTDILEALRYE